MSDRLSCRQWFGFMAMVLGMFMAILDIQIVSASISDIQAGLGMDPGPDVDLAMRENQADALDLGAAPLRKD